MDKGIEFNESAFRHGISKEDIKYALKYPEAETYFNVGVTLKFWEKWRSVQSPP